MSVGETNQGFSEVDKELRRHSLNLSIHFEDDRLHDGSGAKTPGRFESFRSRHNASFKYSLLLIFNLLVITYFTFATLHWYSKNENYFDWCDGYGMLLLIVGFSYFLYFYNHIVKKYLNKRLSKLLLPCVQGSKNIKQKGCIFFTFQTGLSIIIALSILIFIIIDTLNSPDRLKSLAGIGAILAFGWIFSKYPTNVNWKPVVWGMILQFAFGLFTIRWSVGRIIFKCMSDKVATFLDFAHAGASFIYSEQLVNQGIFAFSALPVIFFCSFFVQVLYYWGIMQVVITKIGWLLHIVMGTTVCESMNSAANTFIGMTESPLLIKPYLNSLTGSEIHAIMCSGFATVSGTVLAAYIKFGANPAHLVTASLMSAPAALCFSKLFYPETEKSATTFKNIKLEKSQDTSVIDAATKGALAAIPLVLGIIANIIAFVSATAFLNAVLAWFSSLVGYEGITFEWVLSKVFMPLSWLMGVPWSECEDVGHLIGLKTVVNEFIAYQKLGELKEQTRLTPRTEAIATYAICGFSNPGSIGIMIGGLTSMAPEKRHHIAASAIRAFIAGSLVCFLTACTAGVLMDDTLFETRLQNFTISES
ncbi:hypothetical protein TKK_0002396 [Trichogramma kaykai]